MQLCEAVFGVSDEMCRLAMRGMKYAGMWHFHVVILRTVGGTFGSCDACTRGKFASLLLISHSVLNILVVSPDYQGRGIGSLLIRDGLEEVDGMWLPAWLGATDAALPLYKKVGFEVDKVFEFDMTPYGGEGLTKHTLMIRPAVES